MTIPKREKRRKRVIDKGLPAPPFNKAILDPRNTKDVERKTTTLHGK